MKVVAPINQIENTVQRPSTEQNGAAGLLGRRRTNWLVIGWSQSYFIVKVSNQSQSLDAQRQSEAIFELQVKSISTALAEILSQDRMRKKKVFLFSKIQTPLEVIACHFLSAPHSLEKSAEQLFKWDSSRGKSVDNDKPPASIKMYGWKPACEMLVEVYDKLLKLLAVDIKGEKNIYSPR